MKSLDNHLAAQLALEAKLQQVAGCSDEFAEGMAAFGATRAPRYG